MRFVIGSHIEKVSIAGNLFRSLIKLSSHSISKKKQTWNQLKLWFCKQKLWYPIKVPCIVSAVDWLGRTLFHININIFPRQMHRNNGDYTFQCYIANAGERELEIIFQWKLFQRSIWEIWNYFRLLNIDTIFSNCDELHQPFGKYKLFSFQRWNMNIWCFRCSNLQYMYWSIQYTEWNIQ